MVRRIFAVTALTMLVSVLVSSPAAAQNQGYSVWAHRNEGGGGGGGRGYFRSPSYEPAYAPPVIAYGRTYYGSPTYGPAYQGTDSYYTSVSPSPVSEQTVTINMSLPSSAKVWFNDAPTTQTGPDRTFVSPTITPGKNYVYTIRASWTDGGRKVERTKDIAVHAGDRINLDFTKGS
ncbi:MAG TPA: TIGR03000 domain-containing protein [Gemmataceae bacterium]|nr:TIGR03000 domain-containing protein [Gemmataceae bacterium]